MWISLVVPVAVLLATLLLQRLEAKLLSTPEPVDHPEHPVSYPSDSTPLMAVAPFEPRPAPPRRERATV